MTKHKIIEELEKYEYELSKILEGEPFWRVCCYRVVDRLYNEGRIDENEYERFQVLLSLVEDDYTINFTYGDLV